MTGLALALIGALVVLLVWGLGRVLDVLSPVLWPLAVAGVLAYLLDPLVDALERRGVGRGRAILLVFGLAVVLIAGLFGSVVPQIVEQSRQLVSQIPDYARKVEERLDRWVKDPPASVQRWLGPGFGKPAATAEDSTNEQSAQPSAEKESPDDIGAEKPDEGERTDQEAGAVEAADPEGPSDALGPWLRERLDLERLQSATGLIAGMLARVGSWFFGQLSKMASWFAVLAGLALIPIYTFYFLLEKQGIQSRWTDYLPVGQSGFKDELVFVLQSINNYLIAFFRGQVLVAVCDGILYAIGFALIGLPYALLIGVVAMFLTIIPFVGAIITCAGALLIAVVQYGDWLHPLLTLGVFAVVQALESYVIQPKILGDRVGLHPLTIIVSVMVGTTLLGGILGGLLAIPFTAALRVIMFRYVWQSPDTRPAPGDEAPEGDPPARRKRRSRQAG